jgi:hypothetical protein
MFSFTVIATISVVGAAIVILLPTQHIALMQSVPRLRALTCQIGDL